MDTKCVFLVIVYSASLGESMLFSFRGGWGIRGWGRRGGAVRTPRPSYPRYGSRGRITTRFQLKLRVRFCRGKVIIPGEESYPLICYKCNSKTEIRCGDPNDVSLPDSVATNCGPNARSCLEELRENITGARTWYRGCSKSAPSSDKSDCDEFNLTTALVTSCFCNENYCNANNGGRGSAQDGWMAGAALLWFSVYKRYCCSD